MTCQVDSCRYPQTHTTRYHKCGKCNGYGHGCIECAASRPAEQHPLDAYYQLPGETPKVLAPDYSCVNALSSLEIKPFTGKPCQVASCPIPQTHSSEAHQPEFDSYATLDGPDYYGIRRRRAEGTQSVMAKVAGRPGTYNSIGWGMGNVIYARNISGKVEVTISEGDVSEFIGGLQCV